MPAAPVSLARRQVPFLDVQQRTFRKGVRLVSAPVRVTHPAAPRIMAVGIMESALEDEDLLATGVHVFRVHGIGRPAQEENVLVPVTMQRLNLDPGNATG